MLGSRELLYYLPDDVLFGIRGALATAGAVGVCELETKRKADELPSSPLSLLGDSDFLVRIIASAAMAHESAGTLCPFPAMVAAVYEWWQAGCLDIEPPHPTCGFCGEGLTLDTVGDKKVFTCLSCDIVFGASWVRDPTKRTMLGLSRGKQFDTALVASVAKPS